eukprot:g3013.t1
MRLFSHNLLKCNIRGVEEGYPLKIEATEVEVQESEYNPYFIKSVFPKLEWSALREAATALQVADGLPEECTLEMLDNEEFSKRLHHILLEVIVVEGHLICPETGRRFPINGGIPNMLLREDEI